jgi:flagellar basal-body rod protein FlgB
MAFSSQLPCFAEVPPIEGYAKTFKSTAGGGLKEIKEVKPVLGDLTWKVMEKSMEGLARRFEATSGNMANANTPGYARRNISFEDELRDVVNAGDRLTMTVTNAGHIPTRPSVVSDVTPAELRARDEIYRLDGNNVDPEKEMAVLSETRMMYNAMGRFAARKLANYRMVIAGR